MSTLPISIQYSERLIVRGTDNSKQDQYVVATKSSSKMSSSKDPEASEAYQEREEYNVDNDILTTSSDGIDIIGLRPSSPN